MTISVGDKLPDATFTLIGEEGPQSISLEEKTKGRNVAIFAVPGAFTPTCHSAHVPSFIRASDRLADKGVEEIICISVNDPYVMKAWGEVTGADKAGLTLLADAEGAFTKAIGMEFTVTATGLIGRSKRYAMHVVDGVIEKLNIEQSRGTCEISGGEALLDQL